jgi:hypothetical protein
MQVHEILNELRVAYENESGLDLFIAKLKKALMQIPEHEVIACSQL